MVGLVISASLLLAAPFGSYLTVAGAPVGVKLNIMLALESLGEAQLSASSSRFESLERRVDMGSPFELNRYVLTVFGSTVSVVLFVVVVLALE